MLVHGVDLDNLARAQRIARKSNRKAAAVVAAAALANRREQEYRAAHGPDGPLPWRVRVLPIDPWANVRKRS